MTEEKKSGSGRRAPRITKQHHYRTLGWLWFTWVQFLRAIEVGTVSGYVVHAIVGDGIVVGGGDRQGITSSRCAG